MEPTEDVGFVGKHEDMNIQRCNLYDKIPFFSSSETNRTCKVYPSPLGVGGGGYSFFEVR